MDKADIGVYISGKKVVGITGVELSKYDIYCTPQLSDILQDAISAENHKEAAEISSVLKSRGDG